MRIGRPSSTIHNDWNSLLSSFKKYVKKDDTVLEIGASVYERTKDLAPYCKKIIGVELFPERIPKKKSGGKIIRVLLQQADEAGLTEKVKAKKGGRQLTVKGKQFLESLA